MRANLWQAFRICNRLNFGEHFTRDERGKRLNEGRGKARGKRITSVCPLALGAPNVCGFHARQGGREGNARGSGNTSGNGSEGGKAQRNGARAN